MVLSRFSRLCLCLCLAFSSLSAQNPEAESEAEALEPFPICGHVQSFDVAYTFNFRVEKNRLRVYFIDADEQLVEERVVDKINARINPRGDDPEFVPLRWDAATSSFTNPRFIRKPYIMRTNITMIAADGVALSSFQFFITQKHDGVAVAAEKGNRFAVSEYLLSWLPIHPLTRQKALAHRLICPIFAGS